MKFIQVKLETNIVLKELGKIKSHHEHQEGTHEHWIVYSQSGLDSLYSIRNAPFNFQCVTNSVLQTMRRERI